MFAAIIYEDGNPIRLFRGSSCISNAYKWCHKEYYLEDEGCKPHQLPSWLEVKFFPFLTEEQFESITK